MLLTLLVAACLARRLAAPRWLAKMTMKSSVFTALLLFCLGGLALGFFGMLYEGVVILPAMLDTRPARLRFWGDFYAVLSPLRYYLPVVPAAALGLLVLWNRAVSARLPARRHLAWAGSTQLLALLITGYMVLGINLKLHFTSLDLPAAALFTKVLLMNVLSAIRLLLAATALVQAGKAYVQTVTARAGSV